MNIFILLNPVRLTSIREKRTSTDIGLELVRKLELLDGQELVRKLHGIR